MDADQIRAMMTLLRTSAERDKAEAANDLTERFARFLTLTGPGNIFLSTNDGVVGEIEIARGGKTGTLSLQHVPAGAIHMILEMLLEMGTSV